MFHPDDSTSANLFETVLEAEAAHINGGVYAFDIPSSGGGLGTDTSSDPFRVGASNPTARESRAGSNVNFGQILGMIQQFSKPSPYLQDPAVQAAAGQWLTGAFGGLLGGAPPA